MSKRLTKEEFILKSQKTHGDKYLYHKVEYINSKTKVCIVCPAHGDFNMQPNMHTNSKQGCPECAKKKFGEHSKMSYEDFKKKSSDKYDCKYIYEDTEPYNFNMSSDVQIMCPTHGRFKSVASQHLHSRYGCASCALECRSSKRRMTLLEFKSKAFYAHGDTYDYKLVKEADMLGIRSKISIICRDHGVFKQSVSDHIHAKSGCQSCCQYGFRKNESGKLYVMQFENITKIGITNGDPSFRARQISKSSGRKFQVVMFVNYEEGVIADQVETDLLTYLRKRYSEVSDKFDGHTECFVEVNHFELLKQIANLSVKHLNTI